VNSSGLRRSGRNWVAAFASLGVVAVLAACSGSDHPAGAPAFNTKAAVGASEQMPGAAPPTSDDDSLIVPTASAKTTRLDTPFDCPTQTTSPTTSGELRTALREAKPGDVILLSAGTYSGHFEIKAKGTDAQPIYLCGSSDSTLNGRNHLSGYTLHIDGAENWRLDGFTVRLGQKGVVVDDSSRIVLQGMTVADTGNEAVHLRNGSSNNVVRGLTIRKTGVQNVKFGEGIYVGSAKSNWCDISDCQPDRSNDNQLVDNRISYTSAESIDVKEGTTGGLIKGNSFDGRGMAGDADSWVDIKGNDWKITSNHGQYSPKDGFQTHVILDGWGNDNVFSHNTAILNGAPGVGYYLHKTLKNQVTCDNTAVGAGGGLSNVPCRG
jgi:hypothetical protein